MVSIIMPCYNSEKYISHSIESVLAQSMNEWELLIVNDASTDGTSDIIDRFSRQDTRIRVFHLKINSSAAVARNVGIANAKYKYIAFLDSDDIWLPSKLDTQIGLMEMHGISFSYSSYYVINNIGKIMGIRKAVNSMTYKKLLKYGNDIGCLTVVYNREMFNDMRFDENIRIHEDYKMWLDIFRGIDGAQGIKEPLALYRVHSGSKNLNKFRSLKWNWMLWRKYEKLSFGYSLIVSIRWIINKIIQRFFVTMLNDSSKKSLADLLNDHKSVY